ncbi:MAG: acyltransferase, partial [Microbacterium sp.]|nr:acyltransferase [Microbacterium sp.]
MSSTPPERPATSSANLTASATGGKAKHFLPHVQGLRAIAVLLVVIYHVWPGRLEGGYVGVDVFFVISGFLITGQLVRELDTTGRIRLGTFWAKRARRLLPAAILVLVVSAVLALVFLPVS